MSEKIVEIRDELGGTIRGVRVQIARSVEQFSTIELEDGTVLKTKISAIEALRVHDSWDEEGNPVYVLRRNEVVSIVKAPDNLKNMT